MHLIRLFRLAWSRFSPVTIVRHFWAHRDLIMQMTAREVSQRYRGSFLGIIWSILNPLVLLLVYTLIFGVVFQSRWQGDQPTPPAQFALILFAGLLAFNVFSEVANRAPSLVINVPNYVKKVVFPLEILPVVALGAALVTALISIGLILIGSVAIQGHVPPTVVFLPLVFVPLCLLSLAVAWVLSSLGVYIRDLAQAIGLFVQVLFFLSPIFFPLSAVPEAIRPVYVLNPLSAFIESFRATLIWGQLPDFSSWLIWTALSGLLAILGYAWFTQTKKGFADVL